MVYLSLCIYDLSRLKNRLEASFIDQNVLLIKMCVLVHFHDCPLIEESSMWEYFIFLSWDAILFSNTARLFFFSFPFLAVSFWRKMQRSMRFFWNMLWSIIVIGQKASSLAYVVSSDYFTTKVLLTFLSS